MDLSIIIELAVSAGAITAAITGFFSLSLARQNNNILARLEKDKQSFTVQQEKYKQLYDAYKELLSTLPEDQKLGHYINNLYMHADKKRRINPDEMQLIAEKNIRIMVLHYEKYIFLYDDDFRQSFETAVKDLDRITHRLAPLGQDVDSNLKEIHALLDERFSKVAQLEELYFSYLKSQLSSIVREYES